MNGPAKTNARTDHPLWFVLAFWLLTAAIGAAACSEDATSSAGESDRSTTTKPAVEQGRSTAASTPLETSTVVAGSDPGQAVVDLAEAIGANLVLATSEDGPLMTYQDGMLYDLPEDVQEWASSDGAFIYSSFGEGGATLVSDAFTPEGNKICSTNKGRIHHVTQRQDGTHVMAVEQDGKNGPGWAEWEERDFAGRYAVPMLAIDCQTGDSQPIEPVSTYSTDGESTSTHSTAGRTFTIYGDAEGNADVRNEQDLLINGDDYAGYATFSQDATLMAYGDMGAGAGPHFTPAIVVRDTTTGERLWGQDFGALVQTFDFVDDRLVVLFPADDSALLDGSRNPARALILNATTGEQLDELSFDRSIEVLHIS